MYCSGTYFNDIYIYIVLCLIDIYGEFYTSIAAIVLWTTGNDGFAKTIPGTVPEGRHR